MKRHTVLAASLVALLSTQAHAGPADDPLHWFQYVDAEVGASVLPDSSIDCDGADGKRQVSGRAKVTANIYQTEDDRLVVDAILWEHVGCGSDLNGGQAFGGPGLTVKYRLWSR